MKIRIRDLQKKDMGRILGYREETACISFPGMKMDMGKCRESMLLQVRRYPGTIKVAEAGGRLVGYISFGPRKGSLGAHGRINIIFVEERYRKHGIGELLLEEAEKWFRSHGISRIDAVVTNTNSRSMDFFRERGYREKRTVFEKRL